MQFFRIITNGLFFLAQIVSSIGVLMFFANPIYPVWAFIASVFAMILGILGSLINFNSPSYLSEQELELLKNDYKERIAELDQKKELYLKLVEEKLL
jgi:hypothetical protein